MSRTGCRVEGFGEFDVALAELSKMSAKNAMVRTLKRAAVPIRDQARELAPKASGDLARSIAVGTKLTARQAAAVRRAGKATAEVYVGTSDRAAVPQEFGTVNASAHPFMRPAWDEKWREAAGIIAADLAEEFARTAARAKKRKR